ncbi:NADH-quinone oxidoreductase subunit NuoN [Allochromatium vinosum]|uniref:NADH-quinone oxidoreductase subunit N n=1 Tax=Allochromatium vinosum (strain ATCC 17899 / DSM 180 / NBRC 103801 / NCIMB 10441 / D) TaxID=572477 RepID=D3RNG2_ALLVD|nr:NADH-quinone oxidoreductase subunit NuoN [Allochromatium vinosum]ADC63327.1 proton-translocating NADH-quinone oxidoreductase, chain N [Allochromatium vinosum DSM 180]
MTFDAANLLPILPEIAILVTASVVLILDLYLKDQDKGLNHSLTLLGLVVAIALTGLVGGGEAQVFFDGNLIRDAMTDLLRGAILIVSILTFVYARPWLQDRGMLVGEFYVLGLLAVLGMLIMVSANGFLTLYLGLELQALALYALVAFDRDSSKGAEAAMKYFVLGALGSGLLLYGVSMIYGATGSIEFAPVAAAVAEQGMSNKVLVFGIAFLVIGIGFKFGAVPFHMWVPDVYEGGPTPAVLILSSAPKIAAFALAVRMLVDGLHTLHPDWQGMLVILAVLSMGLGNLVAIAQSNIKRMLAYSTISHVGFIFLGLLAGSAQGYAAAMFYTIVYAVMSAGAFGILLILSRQGFDAERLEDLKVKGLNDRDAWYAAMMALIMFSMAGVPPTVGFMAKLLVLEAVVRIDMVWLALVAVFFSIIGAFYYLRVIKFIYFDKPAEDAPALVTSSGVRFAMSLNGLALLALGLFPAALLSVCQAAF